MGLYHFPSGSALFHGIFLHVTRIWLVHIAVVWCHLVPDEFPESRQNKTQHFKPFIYVLCCFRQSVTNQYLYSGCGFDIFLFYNKFQKLKAQNQVGAIWQI